MAARGRLANPNPSFPAQFEEMPRAYGGHMDEPTAPGVDVETNSISSEKIQQ